MVHSFLRRQSLTICPKWNNLALKRNHCLDTDDGTLAAMMSSKVDVSLLVDWSFVAQWSRYLFSVPWHTCANRQLLWKPIAVVIESVWTNVWFPALCKNTVILTVCRDFQCKILFVCEDDFLYSSHWEAPVQYLASSFMPVSCIGIHCWCSHSFEWTKAAPLQHSLYGTEVCDTPMICAAWRWLLWVPGLSSGDWQSCSRMMLCKNPIDASVIPLLVWKFFCNPSTSPSFFNETRNNNCQIVFMRKPFAV